MENIVTKVYKNYFLIAFQQNVSINMIFTFAISKIHYSCYRKFDYYDNTIIAAFLNPFLFETMITVTPKIVQITFSIINWITERKFKTLYE